MKHIFILLVFIAALSAAVEKKISTNNEHVKLEMKLPEKISLKSSGTLSFLFTPLEGIHINTDPEFELLLEKQSVFEITGNPRYTKNKKGYLETKKPIEFTFKAKNGTMLGRQTLRGKLNYFYCSDKDGWCNRCTEQIEIIVEVVR